MSNQFFYITYGAVLIITYSTLYLCLYKSIEIPPPEEKWEIDRWVRENNFEPYRKMFESQGRLKLLHMATIEAMPQLTSIEEDRVKRATLSLKEKFIFAQYLKYLHLHEYFHSLVAKGVSSLVDVYSESDGIVHEILGNDFATWTRGKQMLPTTKDALETFKSNVWSTLITSEKTEHETKVVWFRSCLLIFSAIFAGFVMFVCKYQLWTAMRPAQTVEQMKEGRKLEPRMCKFMFHWSDPCPVGQTLTYTVEFFQRNGFPYPVCDRDGIRVEIYMGVRYVQTDLSLGGTAPEEMNIGRGKFSIRYAGTYRIGLMVQGNFLPDVSFKKNFLPGPVDPTKTRFAPQNSTVVCCPNNGHTLLIETRDTFGNLCVTRLLEKNPTYIDLKPYRLVVKQDGVDKTDECTQSFSLDHDSCRIAAKITFSKEGHYKVQAYYNDMLIPNGNITCIVLSFADYDEVQANVNNPLCVLYDVLLTRIEGEPCFKPRKVTMYMTSRQITLREFVLRFLVKRIATYRVCPSIKVRILEETCNGVPMFSVEDSGQPTMYLAASNRNVIVALYASILLNNIGGSETLKEKEKYFYSEIRKYHQAVPRRNIEISVEREHLLQSSIKATKNFELKDWCGNFELTFIGENGVDYGGVRKEWFQCTFGALFCQGPKNLFNGFNDDPQALVHPNKYRASHLKLKYYEFAGKLLGKVLFDTAVNGRNNQFLMAKFTRSFLAQLIGLGVNHSYFQSDDPDLYLNKVRYILNNDVSDMGLYFTDEEYNTTTGKLIETVDLIPNGSKIKVTNSNKRQYLDLLAQFRLAANVKDEIEAFLKGLNEIIPEHFLCMFDENELELLLCGTGEYSIADFRAHHTVSHNYYAVDEDFSCILTWFWVIVSNFTPEEMAKLLQFATGSSQLPPGGFKDLKPIFQLSPLCSNGKLPTAHTCFNQLCLPQHDTFEEFEKSLRIAINEGLGFGLC